MRGIELVTSGFAVNPHDGVRIAYEVFGSLDAERTIVFVPTWILIHSRNWKAQVPYFVQRGFRVVTYDGRGNGKSGRPATGYTARPSQPSGMAWSSITSSVWKRTRPHSSRFFGESSTGSKREK